MCTSPQERSRTRRTRRSYQPEHTRPQPPQIVFLSAVQGRSRVPSDHRTHRTPWCADENRGRRTRPTAAAVASMNSPSTPDAKLQHPAKCPKANIHRAFCHVHPIKSPTRLPEDPELFERFDPTGGSADRDNRCGIWRFCHEAHSNLAEAGRHPYGRATAAKLHLSPFPAFLQVRPKVWRPPAPRALLRSALKRAASRGS